MKTVILNGSPRAQGTTVSLLKLMAARLAQAGSVEWFDVCDLDIAACRGCMGCRPAGDCVLPVDDALKVRRAIAGADALVVGTPTYWGNMSGPLKILFDRTVTLFETFETRLPSPRLSGKRAAIVVACGAPPPFGLLPDSGGGALRSVRRILRGGGVAIQGSILAAGMRPGTAIPPGISAKALRVARRLLA